MTDAEESPHTGADGSGAARGGEAGSAAPETLIELTDEETAVLFGNLEGLVASPYLDQVPDDERTTVLHTAYRSLLARGVIVAAPPTREPREDGRPEVEMAAGLAFLADIRDGAPVLLCLQRTVDDECVLRYAHVVDRFVLVEDVLEGGLHRFGWLERDRLRACLQEFLVPDGAVAGSGEPVALTSGWAGEQGPGPDDEPPAVPAVLEQASVNIDATVRHLLDEGPGELLGFFLGHAGSWLSRNQFGAGGAVILEPVEPTQVGRLVEALVVEAEGLVNRALAVEEAMTPG
ncbi:hypothetical protein [Segeticoccus rhizosphaerae]|jgi:hypothetical protein|uniref:hypothetical protein n=1 Tax=Segeticoccus rhizosphaerae TaxID=1104777 RepID=UPI0010BF7057|nr:hypothetical protein [Ornithinicoccus soli]